MQSSDPIVWNGFTQAALDAAYNNTDAVADSAAQQARRTAESAELRATHPGFRELRYGPRERNVIDIFPSGVTNAPLFVFIHGGYWQRNTRGVFSVVAKGPLAHGFDVALPGYTLAPDAALSEIVAEVQAAVRLLRRDLTCSRLITGGWSAGGHLTAMTLDMPEVDAALCLSGIYELEPIKRSYLDTKLKLTAEEVDRLSPIRHAPQRHPPIAVVHGGDELPELRRQSRAFATDRQRHGLPVIARSLDGHNHFTLLDELERSDGALTTLVRDLASAN